jgi:ATP-dependent Clp protease ATP-binding subunit ClpA
MFNRFSAEARVSFVAAATEATRRGDRRIGTDHLLIGLAVDPTSLAAQAIGVDVTALRAALDALDRDALATLGITVADDTTVAPPDRLTVPSASTVGRIPGRVPLTSAVKEVLGDALGEAVKARSKQLSGEFMLLALLRRGAADPAIALLRSLGCAPEDIRSRVTDLRAAA